VRLIDRLRIWVTPVLLTVLAVLGLAHARKAGILSLTWLNANKDAVATVSSMVNVLVLAVGSALAYFRFFRGRTLATRADISIDVDVIAAPSGSLLHSIAISVNNKGTVTIWEPRPMIQVKARYPDGKISEFTIDRWIDEQHEAADRRGSTRGISAIDSDETADFFTEHVFDEDIWAVTYAVSVTCSTGDTWTKLRTVSNSSDSSSARLVNGELGAKSVSYDGPKADPQADRQPGLVSQIRRLRDWLKGGQRH
jgi:hypothetical protein